MKYQDFLDTPIGDFLEFTSYAAMRVLKLSNTVTKVEYSSGHHYCKVYEKNGEIRSNFISEERVIYHLTKLGEFL